MSSLNIDLSDESMQQLRRLAQQAKTTPEELVRACVEELLRRPAPDFADAAAYVLSKNADLYRRLA